MYTRIQELPPAPPKCTSTVGLCLYSTHIRYCSPVRKGRLGNTLAASRKMRKGKKVKNTIIRLLNTSRTHPGACIRPILIPSPSIQQIRGLRACACSREPAQQITWFLVPRRRPRARPRPEVGRGTRHEVIIDFVKCMCMWRVNNYY